jgi:aspartyl-tRNA(Asn)/glutamyl-tRNA(Gln) amidotransferase subunit A
VQKAIDAAVADLRRAGFLHEDIAVPANLLYEVSELHPLVMKAEGAANHLDTMRTRESDYTFEVGHRLHSGFFVPAADYIRALKLRGFYLRELVKTVFSKVDLLLTPILSIPVPSIDETSGKKGKDYLDMVVALTRNTKVVNYFGVPAISVPCGFTSNRMPVAFQLIGRPLAEVALLRAVHRYQEITDWHLKEPTIVSQAPARANV